MSFNKKPEYYNNYRNDLINMLPSIQGKFLEVGCGYGATLDYVKSRGASYVAGIDISSDAITVAKDLGLDFTAVADIETYELPFEKNEFDCIILADVLEHLYNPWDTLNKLKLYLKDDGMLLLSIPNVKHYTILKSLIFSDEWSYSDLGILDNSHIRFFTLKEIDKLLTGAGLAVVEIRNVIVASNKFIILNRLMFNKLKSFSVFQFHVMATK